MFELEVNKPQLKCNTRWNGFSRNSFYKIYDSGYGNGIGTFYSWLQCKYNYRCCWFNHDFFRNWCAISIHSDKIAQKIIDKFYKELNSISLSKQLIFNYELNLIENLKKEFQSIMKKSEYFCGRGDKSHSICTFKRNY